MFHQPVLKNIPQKLYEYLIISTVILIYILCCAEADIYVPAFPQMIEYFGIPESEIQLIISINFLSLCIASLVAGPLSDSFGRRIVVLGGLFVLMLSSIVMVMLNDYTTLLIWRFIQGIATSIAMVCGGAIFFDYYSDEKAGKLIGLLNAVITSAMAGAPILGAYLCKIFNWRANFITVMIISILVFLFFWLCIKESLSVEKQKPFKFTSIVKDYIRVLSNLTFICYCLIACFPFIAVVVYITNLSVIFVNHLGISLHDYSYYQASTGISFVVFSLASIKIISLKGADFAKNIGGILSIIGAVALFIVSLLDHTNAILICASMFILAAGGSIMTGTFGSKAISIFPDINGIALAACTALRLFIISISVGLTELYFDGTIMPVAVLFIVYAFFVTILYLYLLKNKKLG